MGGISRTTRFTESWVDRLLGRFSVAWLRSAHDSGAGATEGTVEVQPTRRREAEHGDRDRRKRERQRHRPLFRGPRLGSAGGADPRLSPAALLGAIPPFLLQTDDNPEGVPGEVFEGIKAAVVKDRYAYFKDFFDNFYNTDVLGGSRISEQARQASFNVAAGASPHASYACVDSWLTDFRGDLPKIDVPILVVHGTEDRILPISATAARLPGLVDDLKLVTVEGGPHNIARTHPDEVNKPLLEFLAD